MTNRTHDRYPSNKVSRLAFAAVALASLVGCNGDAAPKGGSSKNIATTSTTDTALQTLTTLELNVNNAIKAQTEYQAQNVASFVDNMISSGGPNIFAESSENQDGIANSVTKYVRNPDGTVERLYAEVSYAPLVEGETSAKVMSVFLAKDNITNPPESVLDTSNVIGYDSSFGLIRMQNPEGDDWRLVTHLPNPGDALFSTTESLDGVTNPNFVTLTADFLTEKVQEMSILLALLKQSPGIQPNS